MAEEEKTYTEVAGYKIPKTDDPWHKWGSVALQGLGRGLQGFAQGINGNMPNAGQVASGIGEGIDAYRKRRQEAEEAKKQEEALDAQKQEQETLKPMETASVNPWYNYANKFLG